MPNPASDNPFNTLAQQIVDWYESPEDSLTSSKPPLKEVDWDTFFISEVQKSVKQRAPRLALARTAGITILGALGAFAVLPLISAVVPLSPAATAVVAWLGGLGCNAVASWIEDIGLKLFKASTDSGENYLKQLTIAVEKRLKEDIDFHHGIEKILKHTEAIPVAIAELEKRLVNQNNNLSQEIQRVVRELENLRELREIKKEQVSQSLNNQLERQSSKSTPRCNLPTLGVPISALNAKPHIVAPPKGQLDQLLGSEPETNEDAQSTPLFTKPSQLSKIASPVVNPANTSSTSVKNQNTNPNRLG